MQTAHSPKLHPLLLVHPRTLHRLRRPRWSLNSTLQALTWLPDSSTQYVLSIHLSLLLFTLLLSPLNDRVYYSTLKKQTQVAHSFDEFEGQVVADLGCGTAMLSIGAAILGAAHVIGIDVDVDALEIARANIDEFEDPPLPIDLIQSTVQALALQPHLVADTVIMNPPFGTRQKGADMDFLRAAFKISKHSVYSLHKSSTREYIGKVAKRDLGAVSAEVLAQLRYDLPASYKFHKQKSKDIEVDLWRFEVSSNGECKVAS